MNSVNKYWLIASYLPVSLFSLRSSYSTSSGGKTLFVPTPYACKLAMVDAAFRMEGENLARWIFNLIKSREIRLCPPKHLTVNHTFIKIKREPKEKKPEEPYISSIAFREFCYFQGKMKIALDAYALNEEDIDKINLVLAHINYFGKRGSFFQFGGTRMVEGELEGFILPIPSSHKSFKPDLYGITQYLDELGEVDAKDFFERINSFSNKSIELGKHRVLRPYLLPYRQVTSSKSYTYYRNDS
ncbi:hypothetical protein BR63_07360 [Thermanaerosceptrum fracticalcis]|uniref:CRISPR-associated protein Cas5 n=1 Tax=Thermanaerosceptrum fracticalcis TaxID=1712410 RepID=A0A7G6E241_THEFR|nr:hypothetical protein [Thermanaerosceptrum fracticalcis]QNB46145.1 hypothetical protein BR63_07360 [Thermanaerosceptrum fracticalcis]